MYVGLWIWTNYLYTIPILLCTLTLLDADIIHYTDTTFVLISASCLYFDQTLL
jgi:hypothetical protein